MSDNEMPDTPDAPGSLPERGAEAAGFVGSARAVRLAKIIVGIATVLGVLAIFTVGLRYQLLDTDEWVDLSGEVLDEPSVQEALAAELVDVVYEQADLGGAFADVLPDDLQGLGPALAGALRGPITDGVEDTLDSERFQALWRNSNRSAHETMVAILRDETREGVSTADGRVTLELRPLAVAVGETLGLSESVLDRIPEDAGEVVIFESDELDAVQTAVRLLDLLAVFLVVLVIAAYVVAVVIARGHRIGVLRRVGWSLVIAGIVVIVARAIAVRSLVQAVVENPSSRPRAEDVADIATALLGQLGWTMALYGVVIIAFAWLLGDGAWAGWARRATAPMLSASPGAAVGAIVVILLLLVWWSPGRAFESWISTVVLVALVIGAVLTLRRRALDEAPDDTWADVWRSRPSLRSSPG